MTGQPHNAELRVAPFVRSGSRVGRTQHTDRREGYDPTLPHESWTVRQFDAQLLQLNAAFYVQLCADRETQGRGVAMRGVCIGSSNDVMPIIAALPWCETVATWDPAQGASFEPFAWTDNSMTATMWSMLAGEFDAYSDLTTWRKSLTSVESMSGSLAELPERSCDVVSLTLDGRAGAEETLAIFKKSLDIIDRGGAFFAVIRNAERIGNFGVASTWLTSIRLSEQLASWGVRQARMRQLSAISRFETGRGEKTFVVSGRFA